MNKWNAKGFLKRAGAAASMMLMLCPVFSFSDASPASPKTFSTSQAAAEALLKASETNDTAALLQLFAPNGKDLLDSGDPAEDTRSRARFTELAHKKMRVVPDPSEPVKIFILV